MKTKIYKSINISLITLMFISTAAIAQYKKSTDVSSTFNEAMVKSALDNLKQRGVPESEWEGILRDAKNEFEAKQNGTWQAPAVFKTNNVDSPVVIGCVNTDFADSTFDTWAAGTGCHPVAAIYSACPAGGATTCCPANGFVTGRQTLITTPGNDPVAGFPIIPAGRNLVSRLGNSSIGGQAEELSKSFIVTKESTGLTYWYAVVLQDPNHTIAEQPAFEIIMFDDITGDTIPCSYYYVAAGQSIPGFQTVGTTTTRYKTWSTVTLDLNDYLGKQVTIRFRTFDCAQGGHYGYAYISMDCFNSEIADPYFCDGWNPDTTMDLSAPAGYSSYLWLKNGTDSITNTQNINIKNPKLGDQYTVILTPYHTGNDSCGISLEYQIKRKPHPVLPDYCPKQNVFTPNNDNTNEKFETHEYDWIAKFDLKIYDRWGKLMYQSNDPYIEWDGKTKNGNKADDGVYYWHSTYISGCYPNPEEPGYKEFKCHGFLHLFR